MVSHCVLYRCWTDSVAEKHFDEPPISANEPLRTIRGLTESCDRYVFMYCFFFQVTLFNRLKRRDVTQLIYMNDAITTSNAPAND